MRNRSQRRTRLRHSRLLGKKTRLQIYPITFNYGQIAVKETQCSPKNRRKTWHKTKIIDLSALKEIFGDVTSLCNTDIPLTASSAHPSSFRSATPSSSPPPSHTQSQLAQTRFSTAHKAQTNPSTPTADENSTKPSKKPQDWARAKKSPFKHPSAANANPKYSRQAQS